MAFSRLIEAYSAERCGGVIRVVLDADFMWFLDGDAGAGALQGFCRRACQGAIIAELAKKAWRGASVCGMLPGV